MINLPRGPGIKPDLVENFVFFRKPAQLTCNNSLTCDSSSSRINLFLLELSFGFIITKASTRILGSFQMYRDSLLLQTELFHPPFIKKVHRQDDRPVG